MDLAPTLVLAAGLGLLGFVEPCSVGSHLIFLKFLERLPERQRVLQTLVFATVRGSLMAGLGVLAAVIGARFLGIWHGLWVVLGSAYIVLGLVYLAGGAPWMIRQAHRLLPQVATGTGSITLGAVFGLAWLCPALSCSRFLLSAGVEPSTGSPGWLRACLG